MPASTLVTYDRDLCEYALGQVRSHLLTFPRQRTPAALLLPGGFDRLTLPAWVAWAVAALPPPLADHVWEGVESEVAGRGLTADELYDLTSAVDDPPLRLEAEAVWLACERTHARFVTCVPVIRTRLGGPVADAWASASLAYAAGLGRPLLPLAAGLAHVHDWLRELRRLAQAVRACEAPERPTRPAPSGPGGERRTRVRTADEFLTPAEVARDYRVSLSAVYAACRTGQLAHHRVRTTPATRGKYLIRVGDLQAWLDAQRVAGESVMTSASAPASSPPPAEPASPFAELDPARLARAWRKG